MNIPLKNMLSTSKNIETQSLKMRLFIKYIFTRRKACYFIALSYLIISLGYVYHKVYSQNLIPIMKADFSEGWRISSTIPIYPTTQLADGFDGKFNTWFHSSRLQTKGELTIEMPRERIVSKIKISPQGNYISRCPKDIFFEASKNGMDWVRLGVFINVSFDGLNAGQFKSLNVDAKKGYRFYRFEFRGYDEYLTFSELQLTSEEIKFIKPFHYFYYFWSICMAILVVFLVDRSPLGREQ